MTFIDWSDPEGLVDLLLDFVADERAACQDDPERERFLSDLLAELRVESRGTDVPVSVRVQRLRAAHESVSREFVDDPVVGHIRDCIEELERIEGEGRHGGAAHP